MAIVKMKKLYVVAMADQREPILKGLLHLGCVELGEPEELLSDPQWASVFQQQSSALAERKGQLTDVNTALEAIHRRGKRKEGLLIRRRPIREAEFLGAAAAARGQALCDAVRARLGQLTEAQGDEAQLLHRIAALMPWKSLGLPLENGGTEHVLFRLGICPGQTDIGRLRMQMETEGLAAELLEIGADQTQKYLLAVIHRDAETRTQALLQSYGFSAVSFPDCTGTAAQNIRVLEEALTECGAAQAAAAAALAAGAEDQDALRLYADRLRTETVRETHGARIVTDGTVLYFQGWLPAAQAQMVGAFLTENGCAWSMREPLAEEIPDVPVQLKNNWLTRPLNMVTEMYSLPAYDNVDPNPLMAPFFILFYGMMMADMGYGLLMILTGVLVTGKYRPQGTMGHLFSLLTLCGISTFGMGVLTGSFFGDFLTQLFRLTGVKSDFALPALFTPLNDTLMILLGAMALGAVQIITGMAVSFIRKLRAGRWMDAVWEELTWWLVFAGLGLMVLDVTPWVLCGGLTMVVLGPVLTNRGLRRITGVFGSLYNHITGYFGDILSYSRLMALMLAGSVIAQVFNTLGAIPGNVGLFILVSAAGNALNFALNLLGCYVHDLRLQCLEYFGKFYRDGGRPFHPLAVETHYVDLYASEEI